MKKTGRNYARFYALLRLQPGFNPIYSDLIKEGIVGDFTQRKRGVIGSSLSALNDNEYKELLNEMQKIAINMVNPVEVVEAATRRQIIHKILKKLGEMGVNTVNGYDDVNFHIRRLKGFENKILPEYKTEELNPLFKALCNYAEGYIKQQKKLQRLSALN